MPKNWVRLYFHTDMTFSPSICGMRLYPEALRSRQLKFSILVCSTAYSRGLCQPYQDANPFRLYVLWFLSVVYFRRYRRLNWLSSCPFGKSLVTKWKSSSQTLTTSSQRATIAIIVFYCFTSIQRIRRYMQCVKKQVRKAVQAKW